MKVLQLCCAYHRLSIQPERKFKTAKRTGAGQSWAGFASPCVLEMQPLAAALAGAQQHTADRCWPDWKGLQSEDAAVVGAASAAAALPPAAVDQQALPEAEAAAAVG